MANYVSVSRKLSAFILIYYRIIIYVKLFVHRFHRGKALQRHLGPVLNQTYRGINHFITCYNSTVIKIDRDTRCIRRR